MESCPDDVTTKVTDCLKRGMKMLLPPMRERMHRVCSLLHMEHLSKGEDLNLRLMLKSLNDSVVIAQCVLPAKVGVKSFETRHDSKLVRQMFVLLKTLLVRAFQRQVRIGILRERGRCFMHSRHVVNPPFSEYCFKLVCLRLLGCHTSFS